MRNYGEIKTGYWQTAACEGWSNDEMLLGAYLLTGPPSSAVGACRVTDSNLRDDFGWEERRAHAAFDGLQRHDFCIRISTIVVIPKFLRWNTVPNGNAAEARRKEFDAIPIRAAKLYYAPWLLAEMHHIKPDFKALLERYQKEFGYGPLRPSETVIVNGICTPSEPQYRAVQYIKAPPSSGENVSGGAA